MKKITRLDRSFKTLARVVGLGLLTAMPLQAALPFGLFTYGPFNGDDVSIYDLSGTYSLVESVSTDQGPPLNILYDIVLTQDARGKLVGMGTTTMNFMQDTNEVGSIQATYKAKGKVKSSADATLVSFQVQAKGFGPIQGVNQHFQIKLKRKTTIDTVTNRLVGASEGKVKGSELGNLKFSNMTDILLVQPNDGSWHLDLDITPVPGNKLKGFGEIRLSSLDTNFFDIKKGHYNKGKGVSAMKLKGAAITVGSRLNKVEIGGDGGTNLLFFKGKVLGQKIQWETGTPMIPQTAPGVF